MSWEKSRALTPLKRDLLRSFFERHRESVPEYVIEPLDLADLGRYIRDLERRFAEMSFPE